MHYPNSFGDSLNLQCLNITSDISCGESMMDDLQAKVPHIIALKCVLNVSLGKQNDKLSSLTRTHKWNNLSTLVKQY